MFFSRILNKKTTFKSDYVGEEIVNLLDTSFQLPDSVAARTIEVDKEHTARPDLLAYDLYGDEMYADILCKINGISNPYELNEDMFLIIPEVAYIDEYIVNPSKLWDEYDSVETGSGSESFIKQIADGEAAATASKAMLPQAKLKNQKRKPNQAIVGDKRFNIDPVSKIIMY